MAFPLCPPTNGLRIGASGIYGGMASDKITAHGSSDNHVAPNTVDEALLAEEPLTEQQPSKRKLCQMETQFNLPDTSTQDQAYMSRSSPFTLDSPQERRQDEACHDTSFLDWYPTGDATITYTNDSEGSEAISGLHTWVIQERSPLIAQAFEPSREGQQLHLDCLDSATALPLVRYFYTGSYAPAGNQYEDVPTSLLLHCKMYRLGDLYDLIELKQQAQVNVIRQCEFGCSSPSIPIDLCKAIAYAYEYLREHNGLLENIICYCVSCFLRHRLVKDPEFQRLAYKLRPFHQDLCKESMKREFEDDTAAAIIQMPFEPYLPQTYASREDLSRDRIEDVVYHFHGADDEGESKRRKTEDPPGLKSTTLPMRTKPPVKEEEAAEDTSEDSALQMALREKRRDKTPVTPDKSSINDRRIASTAVAPEQPKLCETGNPVLAKKRQFAHEDRARTQGKGMISPASIQFPCSRAAPQCSDHTDVEVASSSQMPSRALTDYQLQLRMLESQNKFRLLLKCQEKEAQRLSDGGNNPFRVMEESSKTTAQALIKSEAIENKSGVDIRSKPARSKQATEYQVDSDDEYEVVAAPQAVEALNSSDSETDTDTVVVDPPTPDQAPRARTVSFAGSVTLVNAEPTGAAASDSDDEWDLV